ncbi:MAG TPA: hypothetical protein PLO93_02300 [Candidatus Omnitrophota bacterium]|nr:hypothetical protein [Candidatus Omnitrophota bacterium]HQL41105.1 hypothetical protein [Candidatus Omnitrophota bacterium]
MREIAFKNLTSTAKRRKVISLVEKTEKQGFLVSSHKTIVYVVSAVTAPVRELAQPEYYICKTYDSKEKIEKFSLRVKGTSYITQEGSLLRIDFCHSLRIDIRPGVSAAV